MIDRYNEIVLRATEYGLLKEYFTSNVVPQNISPPEDIGKTKLFFILSHVLGIGYSISLIVFLLEIFAAKLTKGLHNFCRMFRFGY